MEVRFYNFSKRTNSTLKPNVQPALTCDAIMRNASSVIAPVLELHKTETLNTRELNYVYIPVYDRYYFVTDWTWNSGLWEISLNEDVLASWRDTIGNTTDYVVRSAYTFNPYINDRLYPLDGHIRVDRQQLTQLFEYGDPSSSGIYVIGVTGCGRNDGTPANPGTRYYAFFNQAAYFTFIENLFSDAYAETIVSALQTMLVPECKIRLNPIQYITSVRWFPFYPSEEWNTWASVSEISVGWGFVPISQAGTVKEITGTFIVEKQRIFLHGAHPQSSRGDYLNREPYTKRQLFIPPFGMFDLDPQLVYQGTAINCEIYVDMKTGNAYMSVFTSTVSGETVTNICRLVWASAKVSVELTLTQTMAPGFGIGNALRAASSAVGMTAAGVTGDVGGAVNGLIGVANGLEEFTYSMIPKSTTVGADGSKTSFIGKPTLESTYYLVVDDDVEQRGRPLCRRVRIGAIPGYMVIADPDFSCSGTAQEIQTVREFMAGGFYYE